MILALQIPWVSLEAIRAVESCLGSCGIANLAILQLGKIVGEGGSDYPWGGLGYRVKERRLLVDEVEHSLLVIVEQSLLVDVEHSVDMLDIGAR
ncbi:hypothetical protein Tco_0734176 [Tanacetum coccineum]